MNRLLGPALAVLAIFAAASAARAQVVINEIMYRPGSGFPENTGLEFIELHNPSAAAVDMSGWAITSGTSFTFPVGTVIPAGGYAVVAGNPALVQSTYGISGVFGPWAAGSTLANGGEKVTLSKPGAAVGAFEAVDTVTYASEGDWGTRVRETVFNGWDWTTPANGANKSMELRNPALSNDNGQNWSPSTAAIGATPGGQNSVLTGNVPPIIGNVNHSPAVPRTTDNVTISCTVTDESAPQFLTASLFWRNSTSTTPGSFQQLAMTGDSSGKFSAVLIAPANLANLAIIEFYVSVTDGVGTRTWPAPTSEGQNANAQYQVTNEVLNPTSAYYFLVLTGAENAAYATAAGNDSSNNKIDRQFNTTLIVSNGSDTTIRYRSAIRFRGNSSRGYQFKPLRVSIPSDDPWDDETTFNLNPRASFLQFMGMRMHQLAGVRAPDSIPVKPRRNGVEYTTSTGSTPDYGFWAREEDIGGDLVSNHWPEMKGGSVYKKIDNGGSLNFYWRAGQTPPTSPDTVLDGWSKQNNSSANDWTDLLSFFQTWQTAAAPHFPGAPANNVAQSNNTRISGIGLWNSTTFTGAELANLETVSDFDQWARWFAVQTILQDLETNISNGVDDDYSVYFAPAANGQRRMQLIAHDLDTIFGLGDDQQSPTYTGLFDMTEGGQSGYTFRTLLPLFGNSTTPGNPVFLQKYLNAIRELYGTVFNASTAVTANPAFYQFIDSHLTGWVPAATITAIKNFATQRQAHLLALADNDATTPPPATSSATVTSIPGALMIHEVLANNTSTLLNGATYPDVIELYNAGATAIALDGKSLSDDSLVKAKFVFPAGTTIASGGYLLIFADNDNLAPGLHTGFAFDRQGDAVYLYDTVASGQTLLDSITFGVQPADFSIGRTGAALDTWTLCTPTLGAANTAVTPLGAPGGLLINEWAGNRDYLLDADFIEVFNPAARPVALGLMTLTDDFINYPAQFAIPQLSFIAPGGFVAFSARGSAAAEGNATELPFNIDANFGFLALVGRNGTIVDRVDVVAQAHDTSRGRTPNGAGTVATFGLPGSVPTPGASNVIAPANVLALLTGLRISELLYVPSNLEYIELHNISATTLDLSGVRFVKGVSYTFDAGTTLAPGAYLVVCANRSAFQAQFGGAVPLAPRTFSGSLDNAGETIALQPPAPWDVNILNFAYSPTWFAPDTDSSYALTVIDDVGTPARNWNDKSTWSPSPAVYGTPGVGSPPSIISPLNVVAYTSQPFSYQILATKNATSYNAAPLPAGLSVNTATGLISGTPTGTSTTNVTLSATNALGTGTRTLVLNVTQSPPPTIISASSATGTVGVAFTYQIVATNTPTEFSATNLPPGLSVNANTGLISGTPTQTGTSNITLVAGNADGSGNKALTLTISLPPPPQITSAATATAVLTDPFNYQIVATNSPASFGASGLPSGLSVNTATGLISGAPGATGTFNVQLSATNAGGTGTRTLALTVNSSGPFAALAWSTIATPQQVGIPFAASLTARDAQGRTVTSFNGNIGVTGQGQGTTAAILVITECGTGNVDYFEIENVGNIAANTAGWFIVPNNGNTAIGGGISAINAPWALPATIAPGQVIVVNENTAGSYPTAIDWSSTTNSWCMLCDNTGAVRDFVGWGYTAANIAAINVAAVTVNGTTYNNITVPTAQWSGAGAGSGFSAGIKTRTGTSDHNTSADWGTGFSESNKGLQNTALTVPFVPPPPTIVATPSSVAFTNGVGTGNLTINQLATGMRLVASNGAAITANSNLFDVVTPAAPVLTSPSSAIAVVGGAFSYQILPVNGSTSFNATGLPAGLTVSTATGLISGTPTVAGTSSITLSATNLSGTGTLGLSLEVQADADGDGMGDAWEAARGLNSTVNDAAGDRDGDGRSNFAEWLAGTSPNDAGSRFDVTSTQIAGNNVVITWSAVRGKRYRVTTRTDLNPGTWTEITSLPVVATTSTASFTHVAGAGGGQRFYRVSVEP